MAVGFEVFFYFEGGHAARSGSRDRLPILAVLDVACTEDARNYLTVERAVDVVGGEDVVVFVEIHHALEGLGVRDVADAEEHEGDRQDGDLAGDRVLDAETLNIFLLNAEDFLDDGGGHELDGGVGLGALEHDGRSAEAVGAVDQRHLGGEAGEEEGFFHGAVAATNDCDLLAAGEEAVAGGA